MKRYVLLGLVLASYSLQAAVFQVHQGLTTSKVWLDQVAKVAECVIRNQDFLSEVSRFPKYTHTTKTPGEVAKALGGARQSIELSTFTKLFSKTIAYRNPGSNIVYFNLRKNPRAIKEMLNTAIHEWSHVVGFVHGDNYANGKQDSVPYRVGGIAEKYTEVCK